MCRLSRSQLPSRRFAPFAEEIVVAVDSRVDVDLAAAHTAFADQVVRVPYVPPVERSLAWLSSVSLDRPASQRDKSRQSSSVATQYSLALCARREAARVLLTSGDERVPVYKSLLDASRQSLPPVGIGADRGLAARLVQ
jgi:hypothetical protein